ncbi:MAG: dehydratase [Rhodospirillaceae bacterium]|jgi:3-hydroxybutyryl-CoA dehydratase|nr:dehydratase [Rhodospirillaceae bacterium]|tara:strand:+ start:2946 stop:3395 length:450 start_codon:yes stop_codon:yes gene_type:complete
MSKFWEEFELGKRYQTYGRTVTEGDLSLFCSFVGYHVPLFIDEEYAKRTQYGGRIAPSAFTMSVSTAMTESLFRNTVISLMSVERGRFLAPVRAGDTIRTEVEVLEKKETRNPEKGIVTFRDHVLNQKDETVFQIDKIVMLKRQLHNES